jgi:hypothetical protein
LKPIAPQVDRDGGVVTSITDIEQIRKFDAQFAAAAPAGPQRDREFSNGFAWQRTTDDVGREVFVLFNPAGDNCGIRRDEARATKWCELEGAA